VTKKLGFMKKVCSDSSVGVILSNYMRLPQGSTQRRFGVAQERSVLTERSRGLIPARSAKLLRGLLWGALLTTSLLVPRGTLAQIASTGNELNVSYGGYTAVVLQNSPVNPTLLSGSGTNEFIINVSPNPNVTARVYITNQTANACNNLTISFASSANSQISSFNQFPQDWFQVPIIPPQGGQVNSLALTLAANQSITITTLPIFGNKLVIFLPLSSGCATTNIDMQVILSNSVQPPTANLSSTNTGTSAASPVMSVSDVYSAAFWANTGSGIVGPSNGENVLFINANSGAKSLYFDSVVVTSSTATTFTLFSIINTGSGCTATGINNMKIGGGFTSVATARFATCAGNPGSTPIALINVPANGTVTIDLRGFIALAGGTTGLEITTIATAGTVDASFKWYEK